MCLALNSKFRFSLTKYESLLNGGLTEENCSVFSSILDEWMDG